MSLLKYFVIVATVFCALSTYAANDLVPGKCTAVASNNSSAIQVVDSNSLAGLSWGERKRRILESPLTHLVKSQVIYSEFFNFALRELQKSEKYDGLRIEFPSELKELSEAERDQLARDIYDFYIEFDKFDELLFLHKDRREYELNELKEQVQKYSKSFVVQSIREALQGIITQNQLLVFEEEASHLAGALEIRYNILAASVSAGAVLADFLTATIVSKPGWSMVAVIVTFVGVNIFEKIGMAKYQILREVHLKHQGYRAQIPEAIPAPFQISNELDDMRAAVDLLVRIESLNQRQEINDVHQQLIRLFFREYTSWYGTHQQEISRLIREVQSWHKDGKVIDAESLARLKSLRNDLQIIESETVRFQSMSDPILEAFEKMKDLVESQNMSEDDKKRERNKISLSLIAQRQFKETLKSFVLENVRLIIDSIDAMNENEALLMIRQIGGTTDGLRTQVLGNLLQGLEEMERFSDLTPDSEE